MCFVCRRSGQQQKKSQPLSLFLRKGRKVVFRQWQAKRVDILQFKFDFRFNFLTLVDFKFSLSSGARESRIDLG